MFRASLCAFALAAFPLHPSRSTAAVLWLPEEGGNSHAYEYVGAFVDWPGAVERSAAATVPEGYWLPRLVTISDAAENQFVRGLISDTIWIGFSDAEIEGEWRWIDGTPGYWQDPDVFTTPIQTAWVNWSGEEPNDTPPGEDFGSMDALDPLGSWNDGSLGGAHYAFVVESVPGVFGDTNGDLVVDIADLNSVRNLFGAGEIGGPAILGEAYPPDGIVDIVDLNLVRNRFGFALSATVPEPQSLVLLLAGATVIALLRR